jgi:hypothetical protein
MEPQPLFDWRTTGFEEYKRKLEPQKNKYLEDFQWLSQIIHSKLTAVSFYRY